MLVIWINLRKAQESTLSVLFRILANYTQIIGTILAYKLDYPSFTQDVGFAGDTTVFLSVDCLIVNANLTVFDKSTFVLKTFIMSLLPFAVIVATPVIWLVL